VASLFVLARAAIGAEQLPVSGIAYVGYRVAESGKSHAFYNGVLGLPRAFATPDGTAFNKVGDEQYIEIASGLNGTEDVRLTHIALQTTNIQQVRRMLRSRGIVAGATATGRSVWGQSVRS
jgi:hypothetical protein